MPLVAGGGRPRHTARSSTRPRPYRWPTAELVLGSIVSYLLCSSCRPADGRRVGPPPRSGDQDPTRLARCCWTHRVVASARGNSSPCSAHQRQSCPAEVRCSSYPHRTTTRVPCCRLRPASLCHHGLLTCTRLGLIDQTFTLTRHKAASAAVAVCQGPPQAVAQRRCSMGPPQAGEGSHRGPPLTHRYGGRDHPEIGRGVLTRLLFAVGCFSRSASHTRVCAWVSAASGSGVGEPGR